MFDYSMAPRWLIAVSIFMASNVWATPMSSGLSESYTMSFASGAETAVLTAAATAIPTLPAKQPHGGYDASAYHGPAFLPNPGSLTPSMSQADTNGGTMMGTCDAPKLDPWLSSPGQPMPQGTPWGNCTADNTNPYASTPNTGMTRYYDFTVAKGTIRPDGVEKEVLLVNGQFPGPTIEANWGDYFEIKVTNQLDEGTSLHWHGLLQKNSQWMDGAPGITQCPIAPGSSFTYRFQADLYGTSWWHSHYSAQYADGLSGAIVIYGPNHVAYDQDLGPVILSDWYHNDYFSLVEQTMAPTADNRPMVTSNNTLINGKMNYPCPADVNGTSCTPAAGVAKFRFQSGKKHRLRLINNAADAVSKFSIDNHKITIIANDFVPLQPYETDVVTLGVGQRTDIVVEAIGAPTDAVWMRSNISACSVVDGVSPEAMAAIYYENADESMEPTTETSVSEAERTYCGNDDFSKTKPLYPITPDPNPSTTEEITITFGPNTTDASAVNLWYMDSSAFRVDFNDPELLEAKLGNDISSVPELNVHDFGSNKTVRIVLYNKVPVKPHPMHMHGHNIYVLAEGFGTWDGQVVNADNPERRDTVLLKAAPDGNTAACVVIQFDMDNVGVWPFHCHIAWHVSAGLSISVLEHPEDIKNEMQIPSIMAQTCRDWSAWTGNNVVEQIDSGL